VLPSWRFKSFLVHRDFLFASSHRDDNMARTLGLCHGVNLKQSAAFVKAQVQIPHLTCQCAQC
jgi:hypothetical protein